MIYLFSAVPERNNFHVGNSCKIKHKLGQTQLPFGQSCFSNHFRLMAESVPICVLTCPNSWNTEQLALSRNLLGQNYVNSNSVFGLLSFLKYLNCSKLKQDKCGFKRLIHVDLKNNSKDLKLPFIQNVKNPLWLSGTLFTDSVGLKDQIPLS